jgi:hypothetical protein
MLPTSVPMSGTPSSKADKSLRALFCGAANHLTQLYMSSLKLEKGATKKGYCRAVEDLIKFLQLQQQYGRTISIESLVDHLRTKKREIVQREDNDFGDDEDEHEEGDETPVLGVGLGEAKPAGSAPAPFGASARALASQFEGLSAGGGGGGSVFNSSDHQQQQHLAARMAPAADIASAPGSGGVHFGFSSAALPSGASAQSGNIGSAASSSSTSTSAQFPSSTFRDAVSVPFPLTSSSASSAVSSGASNPFAPLGSAHGSANGRKRQYFEFFFDAPPNLTIPSTPASNGGGGFQFTPSHSTSTSISPAPSSSSLVGASSAHGHGAGVSSAESDGAMDFSCYENQAWKRYRREEEQQQQQQQQQHSVPTHRASANTS